MAFRFCYLILVIVIVCTVFLIKIQNLPLLEGVGGNSMITSQLYVLLLITKQNKKLKMSSAQIKLIRDLVIKKQADKKLFVLFPNQSLDVAFDYMFANSVHHLPVVEEGSDKIERTGDSDYVVSGTLVGIITDRDLRLAIQSPLLLYNPETHSPNKSFSQSFDDLRKSPLNFCTNF